MKKYILFVIVVVSIFFGGTHATLAADIYLGTGSGDVQVGNTVTAVVYVSSSDKSINSAEGIIKFPTELLSVESISLGGSIFSIWIEQPSFSNSAGTVSFNGGVPNPGFIGNGGSIIRINFKAKKAGTANLAFTGANVYANDGLGTDVTSARRGLSIDIVSVQQQEVIPVTPTLPVTQSSLIVSPTHPDQTKWYANNTPEFTWDLPNGALEVRTLIGKLSRGVPTVSYIPVISKKKVDKLSDGAYYFSLRIRTSVGWSEVARYRVNIDTTPPEPFLVTFPNGNKGTESRPVIAFNSTDEGSGVSHYAVSVGKDGKSEKVIFDALGNQYTIPSQYPGVYTLVVSAIDNAGNIRVSSADFTVLSIDAPVITYYTSNVKLGESIKIEGSTYPNSVVTIYIREGEKLISEEQSKSDVLGNFVRVFPKQLDSGKYTFTVRVTDEGNAKSNETKPLTMEVNPGIISVFLDVIVKYLSVIILSILALGGIIGTGSYLWFKITKLVRKMHREAREAEKVSERTFRILRKDIEAHITRLKRAQEKRKLTVEEIAFLEEFEKNLAEAEEMIKKEIQDISHS